MEGEIDVYHYNVVLDNVSHAMGQWADKDISINSYISDAFNHSYAVGGNGIACSQSVPGFRTSASLTDLESGIELLTGASGATGKVEGGYSMSDLYY